MGGGGGEKEKKETALPRGAPMRRWHTDFEFNVSRAHAHALHVIFRLGLGSGSLNNIRGLVMDLQEFAIPSKSG